MNYGRMEEQLILHEGLKLTPYKDTEGFWTVLVGYNVSARGWDFIEKITGRQVPGGVEMEALRFTHEEALAVLRADISRIEVVVRRLLPDYDSLCDARQRVCIDMSFNMGMKVLAFNKAIDAIKRRNWSQWARELFASKWARQVDDGEGGRFGRADRLAAMVLTGLDYTR